MANKDIIFEKVIDSLDFHKCVYIAEQYFDMSVKYIFEDMEDDVILEEQDSFVEDMKSCLKGERTVQDFIEGIYFEESDMGDNIQNMFKVYEYLDNIR